MILVTMTMSHVIKPNKIGLIPADLNCFKLTVKPIPAIAIVIKILTTVGIFESIVMENDIQY